MKTGIEAMRIGIAKFLLPFFFVLSPAMILRGSLMESVQVIPTAALGLLIISGALEGYFWFIGKFTVRASIPVALGGFLLGLPGTKSDMIGLILTGVVLFIVWLGKKRKLAIVGGTEI